MRRTASVLLLLLTLPAGLWGQNRDRAPLVLELPASTRALGMGGAFPLGSNESDAVFYNAALSGSLRGISIAAQWFGSRSDLFTASGATQWLGGAVAFGLQALDYAVSADALTDDWRGASLLGATGEIPIAERVASLAYVRRVKGIRVAVTGKLIEQRNAGERDATVGADISTGLPVGPFLLGLAAQNLGMAATIMGQEIPLPDRITLGIATPRTTTVGPLDVGWAAGVSRLHGGRIGAGGGLEISWWPIIGRTFTGRIGYRYEEDVDLEPVTLGAAFSGDRISIDYAWGRYEGGTNVHRFGLRWR